jgi:hypothetical protein
MIRRADADSGVRLNQTNNSCLCRTNCPHRLKIRLSVSQHIILVVSKGGRAIYSGHDQRDFQYLGDPNRSVMSGPGDPWWGYLLAVAVRGRFPLPISSSHALTDSISDSSASLSSIPVCLFIAKAAKSACVALDSRDKSVSLLEWRTDAYVNRVLPPANGEFQTACQTPRPFQQGVARTKAFARLIGQMAFVRVCTVQE